MKYFVSSDIHSFYDEFIEALTEAGYDKDNSNHCLIICGDIFDRGEQSLELYNFLKSIPLDRRILIRGNHEYLLKDLAKKDAPDMYDFSNGTIDTVKHLTESIDWQVWFDWEKVIKKFKRLDVIKWINSTEWVNYAEIGPFIFVHCFIPFHILDGRSPYGIQNRKFGKFKKWRVKATRRDWENATWNCPYTCMDQGLFEDEAKQNKVLICGHWDVENFRSHYNIKSDDPSQIFCSQNLIALDACTAKTRRCNVLIIDDDFQCYDSKGNKLDIKS